MGINLGMQNVGKQIAEIRGFENTVSIWANQWQDISKKLAKRYKSAIVLLIEAGWPPVFDFPISGMGQLLKLLECGEFSHDDLSGVFIDYYSVDRLKIMLNEWCALEHLSSRISLLSEAINNYETKRYASCVVITLPNIEGILGDYLGKKPNPKNDARKIFDSSGLDSVAYDFYTNVVLTSLDWKNDQILGLSRNRILHGKDTRYGTQENALKVLLLFDAVQRAICKNMACKQ